MSINGREARKRRDRSKRIHLDIQDKIRRQAPDIIAQLWDKTRLDNLDIQVQMKNIRIDDLCIKFTECKRRRNTASRY